MIDFEKLTNLIADKKCMSSDWNEKDDPFVGIYLNDLVDVINQCDSTKWISVEEALPEEDIPNCFVAYKTLDMVFYSTGSYEKDNDEWYVDSVGFNVKVTHYMPIPSLEGGEK